MSDHEHDTQSWMRHIEAAIDDELASFSNDDEEEVRTTTTSFSTPPVAGNTVDDATDAVATQAHSASPIVSEGSSALVDRDAVAQSTRYSETKCIRFLESAFADVDELRAFHAACIKEIEQRCRDTWRKRNKATNDQSRVDETLHKMHHAVQHHRSCYSSLRMMRRVTMRTYSMFSANQSDE